MKYCKLRMWLFALVAVLIAGVIFSHSLMSRETSSAESEWVLFMVLFVVGDDWLDRDIFHMLIRKTAHFVEFAALGIALGGFAANLGRLRKRRYVALPMLLALITAVCDELLQVFSGRASMVSDVVLDFGGGMFGLCIIWLFTFIITKKQRRMQYAIRLFQHFFQK